MEYCSPVYNSALTKQQQQVLARVHRRAVAAITGTYVWGEEFKEICSRLGLEADLGQRRLRLAQRFAKRMAENSCHQDMFSHLDNPHNTRSGGRIWSEPPCRTQIHLQLALPYLPRLLKGETQ